MILKNERGVHNYLEIKHVSNESNASQDSIRHIDLSFNKLFPYRKLTSLKDKSTIEKMLSEKVDYSYLKLKNKYQAQHMDSGNSYQNNDFYEDSQSKSFLQQDESLNKIVLREEFYYMDKVTRELLKNKSNKTYVLLTDLKKMKLKINNEKANIPVWEEGNSIVKNKEMKPAEENKEKNAIQEISLKQIKDEVSPVNIEEIRIENKMVYNEEIKNFPNKEKNKEKKLENRIDIKLENKIENRIENNVENRIDNNIENRIDNNIENNIDNLDFKSETKKPFLSKLESKIRGIISSKYR